MGISERSDLCIPQHLLNQVISQMRTFAAISIILSLSLVASIPVEKEYDDTVRTINNDVTHIALVDRDGTVIDTAPIFTDMQTKQAWWSARRRRKVSWFGHIGKTIKSSPIVKNLVKKAKDTATHLWNKNKGKVLKKVKELAGKAMEKGKEAVERVVEAAKAKAKELQAKLGVSQEDLQLMDGITIELRNSDGDAIEHKSLADVLHDVEDKAPCADGRRANGDGSCTEAGKDRPFCVRARTNRFGGSNDKMCKRKGMRRACPESCMGHDHDSLAEVQTKTKMHKDVTHIALVDAEGNVWGSAPITELQTRAAWGGRRRRSDRRRRSWIKNIWTKIKDGAKKLWNKAKPHIMKKVNQVKDKVVDAGKKLLKKGEAKAKEIAEKVKKKAAEVVDKAVKKGEKVAADLGKKVQEKAEEVSKTVNSHVERLSRKAGLSELQLMDAHGLQIVLVTSNGDAVDHKPLSEIIPDHDAELNAQLSDTESDNVANDDQTPTHIALVDGNGEIIDTAVLNLQTKASWGSRRRRKVSWFRHVGRTIKKHVTPVWNKVKEAGKKLWDKVKGKVMKKVHEVKDKAIEAGKKIVDKVVKKGQELGEKVMDKGKRLVDKTIKKVERKAAELTEKVKDKAAEVSEKVSEKLSGAVGLEDLEDSQLDELERESMEDIQLVLMGPNGAALDAQPLKSIFESDSDKTPEDHDDPVIGMLEKASKARNADKMMSRVP